MHGAGHPSELRVVFSGHFFSTPCLALGPHPGTTPASTMKSLVLELLAGQAENQQTRHHLANFPFLLVTLRVG